MSSKKGLIFLTVILSLSMLALAFPQILLSFLPSDEPTGDVYERVEAERYEIVFPDEVNGDLVYGGYQIGNFVVDDFFLQLCIFSFDDSIAIYSPEDSFAVYFYVYTDGSTMSGSTEAKYLEQGQYGRYVISETQVPYEPVSYTLEPLYDYVLVE